MTTAPEEPRLAGPEPAPHARHPRRLLRSRSSAVFGGVCAGVGEYFDVDPTAVRVAAVMSTFVAGAGLVIYLAALVLVPLAARDVDGADATEATPRAPAAASPETRAFWALVLLVLGLVLAVAHLPFLGFHWVRLVDWTGVWALTLALAGLRLLSRPLRPSAAPEPSGGDTVAAPHRLLRSPAERLLTGVCGGLGAYFDVDPSIVRVLWVLLTLWSLGLGLPIYLALVLLIPEE